MDPSRPPSPGSRSIRRVHEVTVLIERLYKELGGSTNFEPPCSNPFSTTPLGPLHIEQRCAVEDEDTNAPVWNHGVPPKGRARSPTASGRYMESSEGLVQKKEETMTNPRQTDT